MVDRLDSDAVARVLARARELESDPSDVDDSGVSPDVLIEAAAEVGIEPDAVRDSLAIERLTVTEADTQRFDGLAGPVSVVVERAVDLTPEAVLAAIEEWLVVAHRLRCDRRADGALIAHRRRDTSASVGRFVSGLRGEGRLGTVTSLVVEAVALSAGATPSRPRTLVRIEADRGAPRRARLGGGAALGAVGIGAGAVEAAASNALAMAPLVAVPLMVGGYLVARSGLAHADRLSLELERLLSSVARAEQPSGLFGRAARRAARAMTSAARRRR